MGRPKIELGFDVLQVAVDRAKRPTATRPSQPHQVVGRETRSDRDGLVIQSQVKKSRSSRDICVTSRACAERPLRKFRSDLALLALRHSQKKGEKASLSKEGTPL